MAFDPQRHLVLVPPHRVETSNARRFLQRVLPDSWRFAHQMTLDLARQVDCLAWPGRAEAFDTYFLRQAEAMLRPRGLTEPVHGHPGYALVLLAASPNDTAERFMARDAFWAAVTSRI